jgi:hypothetical protein
MVFGAQVARWRGAAALLLGHAAGVLPQQQLFGTVVYAAGAGVVGGGGGGAACCCSTSMMHRAPQPLPAQKGLTNGVVLDCFAPTRSSAAAKAIARFAMATNEKSHAMKLPGGGRQSEELAGPAACRQIAKEGSGTATFFYLNSIIDWPFNFKLHGRMVDNPAWRLKVRPREPTPGRLPSVDTIVPPTLLALQIMPVICLPNCWGGAPSLVLTGTPPPSERQWHGHHAARPVPSTASSLPRSGLTLDRLRYAYVVAIGRC